MAREARADAEVVLHYEECLGKSKKMSTNWKDYTKPGRDAIRRLSEYCESGALIVGDFNSARQVRGRYKEIMFIPVEEVLVKMKETGILEDMLPSQRARTRTDSMESSADHPH